LAMLLVSLPTLGCVPQFGATESDPVSSCTDFIESVSYQKLFDDFKAGAEQRGLDFVDEEMLRQMVEDALADPFFRSQEFQTCLMDEGYQCLPSFGDSPELEQVLLDAARSSGWENPVPNTCRSQSGAIVANPFHPQE